MPSDLPTDAPWRSAEISSRTLVRAQIRLAAFTLIADPELAPLIDSGDLAIAGGRYDLNTGAVRILSVAARS